MAAEVVDLFGPVPPGPGRRRHARWRRSRGRPARRPPGIQRARHRPRSRCRGRGHRGTRRPSASRATVRRSRFDALAEVVVRQSRRELGTPAERARAERGPVRPRGQLAPARRGRDGASPTGATPPLDMRMDPTSGRTAADVVNEYDEDALVELFADNGEGRFARRIARAIVAARPLTTTGQLADVVRAAIPAATRRTGGHPARRVFQAIRIAVNEELDQLETGARRRPRPPAARGPLRGHLLPLGRGPAGQDRLRPRRHRRLPVPARPALRLRRRSAVPAGVPRRPAALRATRSSRNRRAEAARLRVIERLPGSPAGPRTDGEVA